MIRRKTVRKIRKTRDFDDDEEKIKKPVRKQQDNSDNGITLKIEKLTVSSGQFKPVILDLVPTNDLMVVVSGQSRLELKALTLFLSALHKAVSKAVPITDLSDEDEELDEEIVEEEEEEKEKLKKKVKKKLADDEDDELDEEEDEPAPKKKKKNNDDDDLDSLLEELEEE